MRLYTLGSKGSRELKTFLEIHLISSRINQKLKNKGRILGFLKGKLARRSRAVEAVVEAVWGRRGGGFLWHRSWLQFRDNSVLIWWWISPDRGAIGPRSSQIVSHDCGQTSIHAVWWIWKRCSLDSVMERAAIALDHGPDRATIGSCFPPSSAGVAHPMEIRRSKAFHTSPRWEGDRGLSWLSDGDRAITVSTPCSPIAKSGRSVTVRWRSTHPGESTRH